MTISMAGQARFITQIVAFVVIVELIEANIDCFIYVFMRVLPKGENAPFFRFSTMARSVSAFQNLLFAEGRNFILPKRRFWKAEPTFPNAFSKHFSMNRRPNRVLAPLKSASKTHSERLVRPSQIFVWEG